MTSLYFIHYWFMCFKNLVAEHFMFYGTLNSIVGVLTVGGVHQKRRRKPRSQGSWNPPTLRTVGLQSTFVINAAQNQGQQGSWMSDRPYYVTTLVWYVRQLQESCQRPSWPIVSNMTNHHLRLQQQAGMLAGHKLFDHKLLTHHKLLKHGWIPQQYH